MDYFVEELIKELNIILNGTYSLVRVQSKKNNDTLLTAIRFEQKGKNVSPIICVDKYYEEYVDGSMTIKSILISIQKQLEENEDVNNIVDELQHYELIKNDLAFALINYEINKDILKERPHKRFLDLAVVGMVRVKSKDDVIGVVYVTHKMLNIWEIDEKTMMEQCMRNLIERELHSILNIKDVLAKLCMETEDGFLDDIFCDKRNQMYVLSNKNNHMGANALLNIGLLHDFAMKNNSNLIIFPSSVNELIIILEKDFEHGIMDSETVKNINEEAVYREEWLSNSIYLYDKVQEKVLIYQLGELLSNNREY